MITGESALVRRQWASLIGHCDFMLGRRKGSDSEPQFDLHMPSAALLTEARTKPGGWVYEIGPKCDPNGAVPPEGIKGGGPL
jgi:hypothetical protein